MHDKIWEKSNIYHCPAAQTEASHLSHLAWHLRESCKQAGSSFCWISLACSLVTATISSEQQIEELIIASGNNPIPTPKESLVVASLLLLLLVLCYTLFNP